MTGIIKYAESLIVLVLFCKIINKTLWQCNGLKERNVFDYKNLENFVKD